MWAEEGAHTPCSLLAPHIRALLSPVTIGWSQICSPCTGYQNHSGVRAGLKTTELTLTQVHLLEKTFATLVRSHLLTQISSLFQISKYF